ncbi:hypothetical protein SMACR_04595 [Sordaria macrospora]|uniref:Uncharacterized protein n=1 Tax=Sordaria macrospora TaxID=5147 RepID=A0A8S9A3K4_SORMA|nr:hypothetical protein SMACR_04595 [Sordaria macrospora]
MNLVENLEMDGLPAKGSPRSSIGTRLLTGI